MTFDFLTKREEEILIITYLNSPTCVSDIVRKLNKQTFSCGAHEWKIIKKMAKSQYVNVNKKKDGRKRMIAITEKGRINALIIETRKLVNSTDKWNGIENDLIKLKKKLEEAI